MSDSRRQKIGCLFKVVGGCRRFNAQRKNATQLEFWEITVEFPLCIGLHWFLCSTAQREWTDHRQHHSAIFHGMRPHSCQCSTRSVIIDYADHHVPSSPVVCSSCRMCPNIFSCSCSIELFAISLNSLHDTLVAELVFERPCSDTLSDYI